MKPSNTFSGPVPAPVPDGSRRPRRPGYRSDVIRQFTPNWFAVTMGTGILSLILPQVPLVGAALRPAGEVLWTANTGLFLLFSALYGARWLLFGEEARRVFGHGVASMFIGTIPMGLATVVNGFIVFDPHWLAGGAIRIADALWWLDVALSLGCGAVIPYFMFTRQEHRLDQMTAVWLLPVVAAEVAAASGGLLAPHLAGADRQVTVLLTSCVLWAYSVPVAVGLLSILLLRMALHKLPPEGMAASSWLSLGPIGTGALGMLLLGGDAPAILGPLGMAAIGEVARGLGLVAGLILWGFGLWWFVQATLITARYFRSVVPFNLGWWGYTFPLGVYTAATLRLGASLAAPFFHLVGAALAVVLAAVWAVVMMRTVRGAWEGHLFTCPCVAQPR